MLYLADRFSALLSFSEPRPAAFSDYSFSGEPHQTYYAYDGAGTLTEQLLRFNFERVRFSPDADGGLWIIRIPGGLSNAEKLGDYPVIAPEEALRLLIAGNYFTSVPEEMPGAGYVAKTELVYRAEGTIVPYYRFWVELPGQRQISDQMPENLKTYGAYYVPAVEGQYIANMPLWDGGFN